MRLGDAWAILPSLAVEARNEALEVTRLQALACWAGNFTSEVSLLPPQTLLLEVQGSLRLFGGLHPLFDRVQTGCAAQGHACQAALAPTPRAALWLAAGAPGTCCADTAGMRAALSLLPLRALCLPDRIESRLSAFGVRQVGDLLKLPRAGLGRRLGAEFVLDLTRALGEVPDPQPRFVFPQRFYDRLELDARVEDAERLNFAARRLIQAMCGWLSACGCGLSGCVLVLEQERGESQSLELGFSDPTRDPERIGRVLRERLGQLRLTAPVYAVALHADAPALLPGRDGSLFGERLAEEGMAMLVERLQARVGEAKVFQLGTVPEHRPEKASKMLAANQPAKMRRAMPPPSAVLPRPCWLLPHPAPLPEINGRPHRGGQLALLAGPERIESGWWDEGEASALGDVRRDYFVALSPDQEWLWIFRDARGWFLHGLFA